MGLQLRRNDFTRGWNGLAPGSQVSPCDIHATFIDGRKATFRKKADSSDDQPEPDRLPAYETSGAAGKKSDLARLHLSMIDDLFSANRNPYREGGEWRVFTIPQHHAPPVVVCAGTARQVHSASTPFTMASKK